MAEIQKIALGVNTLKKTRAEKQPLSSSCKCSRKDCSIARAEAEVARALFTAALGKICGNSALTTTLSRAILSFF
jgi:hypothetical protein